MAKIPAAEISDIRAWCVRLLEDRLAGRLYPTELNVVPSLPFDPDQPPVEPPAGCPRPFVWRLARALWQAHQPAADGFCQQCGRANQLYPCPPSRLAVKGLAYACGMPADAGGWAEFLRRRHRQSGRR